MMKIFKMFLLLSFITIIAACGGNEENSEESNETSEGNVSEETGEPSMLDVFDIEEEIPFLVANIENNLIQSGFFRDGNYIVAGSEFSMDEIDTYNLEDTTNQINESIESLENNARISGEFEKPDDFEYDHNEKELQIFRYESPTTDQEAIQLPILEVEAIQDIGKYKDQEELSQYLEEESEGNPNFVHQSLLHDNSLESIEFNFILEALEAEDSMRLQHIPSKIENFDYEEVIEEQRSSMYTYEYIITNPEQFLDETSLQDRLEEFATYVGVGTDVYRNWIQIISDNQYINSNTLLIYKTPEVIEVLGLDNEDEEEIELTNESDNDKEYVYPSDW